MLSIKKYLPEIFLIQSQKHVTFQLARDMFLSNIREGTELFGEQEDLDYKILHNSFKTMSSEEVDKSIREATSFYKKNSRVIHSFLAAEDHNAIRTLCLEKNEPKMVNKLTPVIAEETETETETEKE